MIKVYVFLLLAAVLPVSLSANPERVIEDIARQSRMKVGVAFKLDGEEIIHSVHDDAKYPLMSVFKFPLALAVLDRVDSGALALDGKVRIDKEDLVFTQFSPLKDKYPDGGVDVPLREVIVDTISASDNNGCDLMLRLIGGPTALQQYIRSKGVNDIYIASYERDMRVTRKFLFANSGSPSSVVRLLELFDKGELLSAASRGMLMDAMTATKTGPKRIKGLLPQGTVVAHKTGSGPRFDGVLTAQNDVGIISLPDGRKVYLAVLVRNSQASDEETDLVIARVAKAVFDYYVLLSAPGTAK